MPKNQSRRPALKRYVLYQLPGFAVLILLLLLIDEWVNLPGWLFWGCAAIWLAKEALFFPFVWRSYMPPPSESDGMRGQTGICKKRLDPSGYIFIRGELWKAELEESSRDRPMEEGEPVTVTGMDGLTLIVRPEEGPFSS